MKMTIIRKLGLVLLLSVLPMAMMAQLQKGIEEENRGNYKQALLWYQKCSDPEAKYRMGRLYEHGWGVTKNMGTARYYYNQAAKAGHAKAQQIMNANKPTPQSSRSQTQTTNYNQQAYSTPSQPASQTQSYSTPSKLAGVKGIEDVFKGAHDDRRYIYFNTSSKPGNIKKVALNEYHFENVEGAKFYDGMLGIVNEENHRVGFVDEQGNLVPGGFKWGRDLNYFPRFGGGAALVFTTSGVGSRAIYTWYILDKTGKATKLALGGSIHKASNFNEDGIAGIILITRNAKGRDVYTNMLINTKGQKVFRNLWFDCNGWGDAQKLGTFCDG